MGEIRINNEVYGTSEIGVNIDTLNDLFYGSIEERQLLANAITNKGVITNATDSLAIMTENVNNVKASTDIPYNVIHKNICLNTSATQTLTTDTITIEENGGIYTDYSINSGSIASIVFTVNNTNQSFKTKIPVKKGDEVVRTLKVNYALFAQGYFVIVHLFLVYPTSS